DPDSANFDTGTLTVSLTANGTASDQLAISNDGVGAGQIGVSGANVTFAGVTFGTFTGGANGTNLVVTFDADATPAAVQALTRAITFASTSENPSALPRTVTYTVVDGDGGTDAGSTTATVNVTNTNDAPDINTLAAVLAYTENGAAAVIAGATTVTDIDSTDFGGGALTVGFTVNGTAADQLAVRNEGVAAGQIGVSGSNVTYGGVTIGTIDGTFNGVNGVNLVISLNASASPAAVQALSRNITFANTSDNPSTLARTVTFTVNDGDGGTNVDSATATVNITPTNDAPTVTPNGGFAVYTEGAAGQDIDANIAVADVDSANITGATIRISANFEAGDVLNFTNTGTITGNYVVGTGVLTLTGTDTVANYQAAIRTITFSGTSDTPPATKTVEWVVTDGALPSSPATRNINITAVNDAPVLAGSSAVSYTEDAAPTTLIGGLTVTDVDSANIGAATVTISNGFVSGQDVLTFTNSGGITGNYNAAAGVLTASGVATKAQYQTFLQNVGYQNSSQNPNTPARTVTFQVNDGGGVNNLSNTVTSTVSVVSVNDAPTITGAGGPAAAFTENGAALVIDSTLALADPESNSITGATVAITSNFAGTQDVLAFTNILGITGNYNSGTGVLTLSGTQTLANYETALESVTYQNTSDDPSSAARTVTWTVTDNGTPAPAASVGATSTVTVAAVNDGPVNTVPTNASLGTAVSNTNFAVTGISVADLDANPANVQVQVVTTNGASTLTLSGGASVTAGVNGTGTVTIQGTVADVNATLASLVFKSTDGFNGTATVQINTSDLGNEGSGGTLTDSDTISIGVIPEVFIIDNTGGGTGGNGSAATPFKTINDFNANAADGSGDYVYVRQGTGTYSEADGINLVTGEHLFGQGQTLQFTNPVTGAVVTIGTGSSGATPTISVTGIGAHGIDLASGNEVTGLNVATTLGGQTAVSDTGGTVGALTMNDIDISGVGQAVDIDNGGALTVTIDSLSSSGSTLQGVQLAATGAALTGTFNVTTGAISGSTGTGFLVGDGSGGANTGGALAIAFGGTVTTTGTARAVDIQDHATGAITFSNTVSHTGGGNGSGVVIADIASGTIGFSGNNTYNTGTANAIQISNTAGTVNFSGTLDIDTSTGTGISIATSGSANFTGSQITVNASGSGAGVNLASNTGTIAFNQSGTGLDINTTSGGGFSATGGGTVTIQGSSNTLVTTTGTALNVVNTTIGAGALKFESIAAGTASDTAGAGIILDNTGSSGGLTVTGTGSANTGGVIQHKNGAAIVDGATNAITGTTGAGIFLRNTFDVDLSYMNIHDFSNYGILGSTVNGFVLRNSVVGGTNGDASSGFNQESAISLRNVTGVSGFLSNNISGGNSRNIEIDNGSGTLNLTATGNNIHNTIFEDGFSLEAELTATVLANISNNIFSAHGGDHFNLSLINNAVVDLTFNNNDLQSGYSGPGIGTGSVFVLGASFNGSLEYDISGNGTLADPFIGNKQGGAIFVNKGSGTGVFSGQITNNVIGNPAVANSGSEQAVGIHASARGAGGSHTTLISGNVVREYFDRGIVLEAGEGSPTFVATVINNTVSDPGDAVNSLHGIQFDFGILSADNAQITIDVRNNLIANAGNEPQGGVDFRMRTAGSNDVVIAGYSGGNSAANVQAFIDAQNPDGTTFSVSLVTSGGPPAATYGNGPASPLPGPNLPELPTAPGAPLIAGDGEGQAIPSTAPPPLNVDLSFLVDAAIDRWIAAGSSAAQIDAMRATTFAFADLEGPYIGWSEGGVLFLDVNAAEYGWFIDLSPASDGEFALADGGRLLALPGGAAAGHMDMLSVLIHELGHVAGLGHTSEGHVMAESLVAGVRLLPGAAEGSAETEQSIPADVTLVGTGGCIDIHGAGA
ncbi:hypothetical protein, partial [Ramlibacter sp. WS9]|uniref:beta strand repeat-containing protein n=1 Tax=Ramlibacter sp. WS9 TaxID=1882741 RepID=UPI00116C8CA8